MLKLKTLRVPHKCNQQKSKTVSSLPHAASRDGGMVTQHSTFLLTEPRCSNILESITQPIHIANAQGRIIYRNRAWENFYGFNDAETLGKALIELVLERKDAQIANDAIKHILNGESWTGEFPVKNKKGERFLSFGSCKPISDENGTIVGIIAVTAVLRLQIDHQQPSPLALASKISDLATKVESKMKKGETHMFHRDDVPFGEISSFSRKLGMNSDYMIQNRPRIKDMISAKTEQMVKNRFSWPWRRHEREDGWFDSRTCRYCRHCSHCDQEHNYAVQMCSSIQGKLACQPWPNTYCTHEIRWGDLIIREQIGRGSCGTIYHAMWNGSDVALKKISRQEHSDDLIYLANQEIGDFGMCRINHETHVATKEGMGTPEWMAPEVIRGDQATEKSDVYSYGVVLWEIATQKIPWDGLNSIQVTKTVGLMNQRLDIPKDVDPQWASLIQRCLCSEPESRPTFQEMLDELDELQNQFQV